MFDDQYFWNFRILVEIMFYEKKVNQYTYLYLFSGAKTF